MPRTKRIQFVLPCALATASLALVLWALAFSPAYKLLLLLGSVLLLLTGLVLAVFYNFSRDKGTGQDRRKLEQSLSFLVQHIKDYAIFLIDPGGQVISWNKGAEQIKGYTEAEIIGKPISIFYSDEDNRNGEPYLNLERAAKEGRYESVGLRKRKDGTLFHADVVFTPMYDNNNILTGFIKITRDISNQKKGEEDMLDSLQHEKELNEMKSRFVTLASHEFKTPLSVILTSTILIEKYSDTDMQNKRLKHTHRIKSSVNNLKQILNDFLSLEKLEIGIVKNCPVSTDLDPLVREIIQDMEDGLKKGQHIQLHTAGLPRPVLVDNQLVLNILNNMLSNAIKYSPEQAVIDCTLYYQPHTLRISIRDKGIGIPPDEQGQLFERFFRASNSTGISGTGLGLSIVKRYLDLIGGQIELTSTPGGDTTFTITLPV